MFRRGKRSASINKWHGVIPLVEEFRILKNEIGYTGFLSIEIFNRDYWADSHENVIRNAKAALDAVLAKI